MHRALLTGLPGAVTTCAMPREDLLICIGIYRGTVLDAWECSVTHMALTGQQTIDTLCQCPELVRGVLHCMVLVNHSGCFRITSGKSEIVPGLAPQF